MTAWAARIGTGERKTWYPLRTELAYGRPRPGDTVAHLHAAWRVTAVDVQALNRAEAREWRAAGEPDVLTWVKAPYMVRMDFLGGVLPSWAKDWPAGRLVRASVTIRAIQADDDDETADEDEVPEETPEDLAIYLYSANSISLNASGRAVWRMYPPHGRWPMCSCCGEPVPCRAELRDEEVRDSLAAMETAMSRDPDACWECGKKIAPREQVAAYPGENLDLPGSTDVRFHARRSCWAAACAYELRWIAADPTRQRVLTWPKCGGLLVVHADGSTECRGFGEDVAEDCQGHDTHDHGSRAVCFSATRGMCLRGCTREYHPGMNAAFRRPRHRRPA